MLHNKHTMIQANQHNRNMILIRVLTESSGVQCGWSHSYTLITHSFNRLTYSLPLTSGCCHQRWLRYWPRVSNVSSLLLSRDHLLSKRMHQWRETAECLLRAQLADEWQRGGHCCGVEFQEWRQDGGSSAVWHKRECSIYENFSITRLYARYGCCNLLYTRKAINSMTHNCRNPQLVTATKFS